MSASDLQDMRALLRTQPALVEPRAPMLGLKRMLRRREPVAVPIRAASPAAAVGPAVAIAPPFVAEAPQLSPPRASFGLAERVVAVAAEPAVDETPPIDLAQPIVVPRRRSAEAGAIGAEEVMELRELLAERLPHLLTPEVESALGPSLAAGPADAGEACEAVAETPAAPAPQPGPGATPDWSRRAICFTPERVEMAGEQAVLSALYARLIVEQEAVSSRLAQIASEPMRAAA